jgi:hypothetical protein
MILLRRHTAAGQILLSCFPPDRFGQRYRACEIRLRIFLGQNIEYLAAVRSPMLFKISYTYASITSSAFQHNVTVVPSIFANVANDWHLARERSSAQSSSPSP